MRGISGRHVRRLWFTVMNPSAREVRACAVLGKGKKLYVGNLPRQVDKDEVAAVLKKVCEEKGEVDYVRIAHSGDERRGRNKSNNLNEGYGFVRFKDSAGAERALEDLSRSGGRYPGEGDVPGPLKVEWAKEVHAEDVDEAMLEAKRQERKRRNEHKHRQRRRNKEKTETTRPTPRT